MHGNFPLMLAHLLGLLIQHHGHCVIDLIWILLAVIGSLLAQNLQTSDRASSSVTCGAVRDMCVSDVLSFYGIRRHLLDRFRFAEFNEHLHPL